MRATGTLENKKNKNCRNDLHHVDLAYDEVDGERTRPSTVMSQAWVQCMRRAVFCVEARHVSFLGLARGGISSPSIHARPSFLARRNREAAAPALRSANCRALAPARQVDPNGGRVAVSMDGRPDGRF